MDLAKNLKIDSVSRLHPTPPLQIEPAQTVEEAVNNPTVPPPGGVAPSLRNTQPFDIFGLPTISIPCGFDARGLPVGMLIQGRHFGEASILNVAHQYQRVTDWHRRVPPLAP